MIIGIATAKGGAGKTAVLLKMRELYYSIIKEPVISIDHIRDIPLH